MGYIFIIFSLSAGLIKGFCGKKISGLVSTVKGTFYTNLLRMLICVAVGFLIVISNGYLAFNIDITTFLIAAVSGISTAMFVVSWIFCVRRGAYVMIDVFLMLGGGLTIGLCKLFFNETASINQLIGFVLLVIASYIMCSYSSSIKGGFSFSSFLLLVVCGVFSGLTDFSQKWYIYSQPTGSVGIFNFYTYLFAAVVLLISFAIADKKEKAQNDGKSLKVFLVICVMAVCLFSCSYFKTMAAKFVPSAVLYPLISGSSIVLSAIMSAIFFKEKITPKCIIGIMIALGAIIIMNL